LYCDRDESQRIEEFSRAGWNAYPGEKDVKMGIDLCTRQKLHITKRSENILKEIRGYSRKKDKNGDVLEDPVKYKDHTMDAMRFGVYGLVTRFGFATAEPYKDTNNVHRFSERRRESPIHSFSGDLFPA
jgi:phage terminase large subunit